MNQLFTNSRAIHLYTILFKQLWIMKTRICIIYGIEGFEPMILDIWAVLIHLSIYLNLFDMYVYIYIHAYVEHTNLYVPKVLDACVSSKWSLWFNHPNIFRIWNLSFMWFTHCYCSSIAYSAVWLPEMDMTYYGTILDLGLYTSIPHTYVYIYICICRFN